VRRKRMANNPHPKDVSAVGGAALGAESSEKRRNRADITFPVFPNKSLREVGSRIVSAAQWHLSAFSDENRSPKYRAPENVNYYASGSLSMLARLGKLVFSANINEPNNGAFRLDHANSHFYSSATETNLGSLNISTLDGWVLNPVSTLFPSTPFSPTKPWIKKLFPTFSDRSFVSLAILEAVQVLLFKAAEALRDEEITEITNRKKDIAAIIVDNQEIEDLLFRESELF
jgi:hypothetical protein